MTIPSDFSEKVLDVNAISADRTIVTYKVNAAGNQQIENEANNLAKDIIADLNSQLVDMYMASILSNLYVAQQNVQASSEVRSTNIGSYRTNLLDSAIGSKNIFPTLVSMSASSVSMTWITLRRLMGRILIVFSNSGSVIRLVTKIS